MENIEYISYYILEDPRAVIIIQCNILVVSSNYY